MLIHCLVMRYKELFCSIDVYLTVNTNEKNKLIIMNDIKIKGNWNQIKGKLKQKYGDLTDDDLTYVEGQDDEFIGKLQEKLGKTRDQITSEIKDLLD